MKKWFCLTLTLLASVNMTHAADPISELTGHYYLQNVREAGGELLLKADGRFQWALSYGAVDQMAEGRWSRRGKKVVLKADGPDGEPVFRVFRDDELNIKKPAAAGTWVAIVGVPRVGPLVGVEVIFESARGKQVIAKTNHNGDATVEAIVGDTWKRVGLRRSGRKVAVQWLTVPESRSANGIAAFAVDNAAFVHTPPFSELTLNVEGKQLVTNDSNLRMVYRREP